MSSGAFFLSLCILLLVPSKESLQPTQEFVKENWPKILHVTGGALAGAAILLLIRYHKKVRNEKLSEEEEDELEIFESEAEMNIQETPMILETGLATAERIPDSDKLSSELADAMEEMGEMEESDEPGKSSRAASILRVLASFGRKK